MKTDNKFHGDFGAITDEEKDLIINPKHYKIMSPDDLKHFLNKGLEYLDIMRYALSRHTGVVAHVLGQVFKYSFRLGGKDDELQDATKIAWYGNRLVEEIEFKRGIRKEKPRGEFDEPNSLEEPVLNIGDLVRLKNGNMVVATGSHVNKVSGVLADGWFTLEGGRGREYYSHDFKVAV